VFNRGDGLSLDRFAELPGGFSAATTFASVVDARNDAILSKSPDGTMRSRSGRTSPDTGVVGAHR